MFALFCLLRTEALSHHFNKKKSLQKLKEIKCRSKPKRTQPETPNMSELEVRCGLTFLISSLYRKGLWPFDQNPQVQWIHLGLELRTPFLHPLLSHHVYPNGRICWHLRANQVPPQCI